MMIYFAVDSAFGIKILPPILAFFGALGGIIFVVGTVQWVQGKLGIE